MDIVAKILCRMLNNDKTIKDINDYKEIIIEEYPYFSELIVDVDSTDIKLWPWAEWEQKNPAWWRVYNGVKHNRNGIESYDKDEKKKKENYKFANQEMIINSLAGLYLWAGKDDRFL